MHPLVVELHNAGLSNVAKYVEVYLQFATDQQLSSLDHAIAMYYLRKLKQ